jgi:membrane dipeptidase
MGYIDMHCDTLMLFIKDSESNSLFNNYKQVDFTKLKAGQALAQFFAIFMVNEQFFRYLQMEPLSDEEYIKKLYTGFTTEIEKHKDIINFAKSYKDYEKNKKAGILSAFLTIEDGRSIQGDFNNLQKLYDIGVRLISLTWNFENCFGFPNSKDELIMRQGLKPFGIEAVQRMNELGIIVDVSHLSDGGFWDVVKYSKKPFVASHSNSRTISTHTRNLTDEMIRALGQSGSVAGINFGPEFLNEDPKNQESTIEAMISHIKQFIQIGGIDCVGLGSDFDGVFGTFEVKDASYMPLITECLEKNKFLPSEINKITYDNVERILRSNL